MPKRALKKKLYAHMRLSSMAQSLTLMGVRGSKPGRAGKPPPRPRAHEKGSGLAWGSTHAPF